MIVVNLKRAIPTLIFYSVGILLTWFVYEWEKPHLGHGPLLWLLCAFILFIIGFLWALVNILQILAQKKEYAGSLTLHVLFIFVVLIATYRDVHKQPKVSSVPLFNDVSLLHSDTSDNQVIIVNKKGDSTIYNIDDSDLSNKIEAELEKENR